MRRLVSFVIAPIVLFLALLLGGGVASAFCGFYVSGADATLYSNATMVVMMREGTKTVLSMQNNYQGPPEDFAMVVPVPVVIQEENVKTLPREIFTRVDSLAAPRLVEYWETDPCFVQPPMRMMGPGGGGGRMRRAEPERSAADLGVTIEAQFSVAEYDILILSATDSSGLDTWLRREHYNIPEGAGRVLRPYVESGTKFFVAKVDVERVTFVEGRAVLSPLRVHYDSQEFALPVRLGLLNSAGQQDLLVHILARGQRFEVANYANAMIPTNIVVQDAVRYDFGTFYDLLFRRLVAHAPRSVVTEYSWDASSCDPCPVPALDPAELMTLGADVVAGDPYGFVLTRLHYRYGPEGLGEDLVFRAAPGIIGGRGIPNEQGQLTEQAAAPSEMNNFQGRYVILHPWEGAIACASPVRGRWGGPPGQPMPIWGAPNPLLRAEGEAPAAPERPAGAAPLTAIGPVVRDNMPDLGIVAGTAEAPHPNDPGPPGAVRPGASTATSETPPSSLTPAGTTQSAAGGCASCSATPASTAPTLLLLVPFLALLLRRRR